MKKKKRIMIIGIIIISCILLVGGYFYIQYREKTMLQEMKERYHSVIEVTKKTNLYRKEKNKYLKNGTVAKGAILELEAMKIKKTNQKYFQLKDTNYYIDYQDVKKGIKKDEQPFSYILFNQNVTTDEKTDFYKEDNWYFTLPKKIDLPLMYMDNDYYYVTYFNQILGIKKDQAKLVERENTKESVAEYIPVLHYGKVYQDGETCKEDTCINTKELEKQLATLKEQGFYTIQIEEFKKWLAGNIRLKEKAVLLTIQQGDNLPKEVSNQLQDISHENDLKFQDTNQKATREAKLDMIPRYLIKNNTNITTYKKMLLGEEVKEIVSGPPGRANLIGNATRIPVFNYHFFYDSSSGESCDTVICLDVSKFEEQLKYLQENGWKTLTMEEFRAWMYGEIELPAKSVLLTIDDGGMGTGLSNGNKLIPLLEKYQSYATIFLITAWYFPPDYQSSYLDIESHTNEMHTEGYCSGVTRGSQLLCSTREQVLQDLKSSIGVTGSTKALCYPFYAYNDTTIDLVKESGFQLAFAGGNYKASRSGQKYAIPRYVISRNITLDSFIDMLY